MPDFHPSQFVAGTSAWGSRISVPSAMRIGTALADAGFNRFDTAPTYGSAYAHHVLKRVSADATTPIIVDTKYGQLNERDARGIAKKIYRAPSPAVFLRSLWQQPTTDRHAPDFWTTDRFLGALAQSRKELAGTNLDVFYYHAPPFGVLGGETAAIRDRLAADGVRLGLAEPSAEDLSWIEAHPDQKIVLQIRFTEFFRHYDRLKSHDRLEIRINGLFRDQAEIRGELGVSAAQFCKTVEQVFAGNPDNKFIIGINSQRSVDRLGTLAGGPVSGLLLK